MDPSGPPPPFLCGCHICNAGREIVSRNWLLPRPSLAPSSVGGSMDGNNKKVCFSRDEAGPAGRARRRTASTRLNSTHSTQSMLTLIFSIPININRRRRAFSADWRSRTALSSVQGQRLNGIIGLSMNARNCCIILLV